MKVPIIESLYLKLGVALFDEGTRTIVFYFHQTIVINASLAKLFLYDL